METWRFLLQKHLVISLSNTICYCSNCSWFCAFSVFMTEATHQNTFCPIVEFLPNTREGNVFTGVCHSVHHRPLGYWFNAHPCYGVVGMHPIGMLSCYSEISTHISRVLPFDAVKFPQHRQENVCRNWPCIKWKLMYFLLVHINNSETYKSEGGVPFNLL